MNHSRDTEVRGDDRNGEGAFDVPPSKSGEPLTPWERWTRTPRQRFTIVGVMLAALVLVLGVVIQPPKVIITPGNAEPTGDAITISGPPTYASPGSVYFLTVLITNRRPTLFELAAAQLDSDAVVVDERDIYGTFTKQENDEIDRLLMTEAQASAKVAALRRLGYTVVATGSGAYIRNVVPGAPAEGRLEPGDVVTAVDGAPVATREQFGEAIRTRSPGTSVVFTVIRDKVTLTVETSTVANAEGQAVVGVGVFTADPRFEYPFEVSIASGGVSGPSAGLAFSLGIIDELTPGDITGGQRIAVTGTIDAEGNVGPIGSAREKALTAQQARATLLLVPEENLEAARSAGVDLEIVGVRTLDDALAALAARGGAPVPNP